MQSKFHAFCQDVCFMPLTGSVPLTWGSRRAFCCVFISSLLPPTWQGFLLLWERISSRLPFRVCGKLAQLSQRKLPSVLWCHLLPQLLPFRMECRAFGALLATVLFQKYSAFSKNIQSYASALQLFGFDSNYSLSIWKAETTTQLLVQW